MVPQSGQCPAAYRVKFPASLVEPDPLYKAKANQLLIAPAFSARNLSWPVQ